MKSFRCKRARRHWLANDPAIHLAMVEFPDRASLDAVADGQEMKRLIRDFDRDWPHVKRARDTMVQAEAWAASF